MVGAVIGAALLGWVGNKVGIWYLGRFMPNAELEGVIPVAVGIGAGIALGAGLGTWIALTLTSRPHAGLTGGLVAALTPLIVVGVILLGVPILQELDLDGREPFGIDPGFLLIGMGIALTTALVRFLLTSRRSRERDETWGQPDSSR